VEEGLPDRLIGNRG